MGCEEEPGAEDRKLHVKKEVWTVGSTGIAAIAKKVALLEAGIAAIKI